MPVRPGSGLEDPEGSSVPAADDAWGATHLTPPPAGNLTPPPSPYETPSYVPDASAAVTAESVMYGAQPGDPADGVDAWGATHLTAPPSGALPTTPAPWHEPNPGWMPEEAPQAPSAFSPPEERGGMPAAEIPPSAISSLIVPKPIRGLPLDQPAAGRFAAPAETTRVARRKRPTIWVLGIVAIVVLGLVTYYVWDRNRPVAVSSDIVVPTSAQASAPKVARGDLAVKGYLEALAAGDIEKAISYGPVGGGSRALLVPDALKASLAAAPITNINVTAADATASAIHASYQLGTQAVVSDFKVEKLDDGNWQLAASTTTVRLGAKRTDNVPLIINGQTIGPVVELELVPGTYTMTTGLTYLAYQSTTKITVNDLSYTKPISELPVDVTAEGKDALIQAAQASLAACIDYQQLSPPNCPMIEPTKNPVVPSSIKRELVVADPVSGAAWVVDSSNASVASALIEVRYRISGQYVDGSTTGWTPYDQSWTARADATKSRAVDLSIQWGH
jgi:hypothetical protein